MRWRRIFSGRADFKAAGKRRPAAGTVAPRSCRRWEQAIFLSVSDDLTERSECALRQHLAQCPHCSSRQAQARLLLQRRQEVPRGRDEYRACPETWIEVSSRLETNSEPVAELEPVLEPVRWEVSRIRGFRPAFVTIPLALVLIAGSLFLASGLLRSPHPPTTQVREVLEARWSERWDNFVSGSEPKGEINIAQVIPNPDVIDF